MVPTHAFVGLAIADVVGGGRAGWGLRAAGALCASLPDADVLLMRYGDVAYGAAWGHRGVSHSLVFALGLGLVAALVFFRGRPVSFGRAALALAVATASQGVLDAMTTGGRGVAFFAPFSLERHFLPWDPIPVASMTLGAFFTARGMSIFGWELLHLWLPLALLLVVVHGARRARRSPSPV